MNTERLGLTLFSALLSSSIACQAIADDSCSGASLMNLESLGDFESGRIRWASISLLVGSHINDSMFRQAAESTVPGVIKSISQDPESRLVTLTLDPSCSWSNGQPITAADVKAGLTAVFSPGSNSLIPGREIISTGLAFHHGEVDATALGIETPDEQTVTFTSDMNSASIKAILSLPVYAPKPSWINAADPAKPPSVFSGPYVIDHYEQSERIELSANPHYCGPPPAMKQVSIIKASRAHEFIELLEAGENIVIFIPGSVPYFGEVLLNSDVAEKFSAVELHDPALRMFGLNSSRPPLDNPDLRRAIALSIDWEGERGIGSTIRDRGKIPTSLIPPGFLAVDQPIAHDIRPREQRIVEARQLLAKHGYNDDNPLELKAIWLDQEQFSYYLFQGMITSELPISFNSKLYTSENADEYYRIRNNQEVADYHIAEFSWGAAYRSAEYFFAFYRSLALFEEETLASFTKLSRQALQEPNIELAQQLEVEATRLLQEGDIMFPFVAPSKRVIFNNAYKKIGHSRWEVLHDMAPVSEVECDE